MIRLKTPVPGPKSFKILQELRKRNGGWSVAYPLVFSGGGSGPYCEDIDGNMFLDFASQIASNPLGYNHPEMVRVVKSFSNRFPVKYAGQDFTIPQHLDLIEELAGVSPKGMDTAFIINSGAEAVENAIKICMRKRPKAKTGISMRRAFHGRTLGALSLTNSNKVQKQGYMRLPMMRLDFDESAPGQLERILEREAAPEDIGFIILEHVQGEGGYYPAPRKMVRDLRAMARKNGIPYISDEVQAGMGRTGKWWAFEHYGITPDVFSSAKALPVGAVVSRRNMFPGESGAISSTWGGGHALDLALSLKTIELIKKQKLLSKNERLGKYMLKRLDENPNISGQRGLGLMLAFDMESREARDHLVIGCARKGLLLLGCGKRSVRVIPPYVSTEEDAERGLEIIEELSGKIKAKGFAPTGKICTFMKCSHSHA